MKISAYVIHLERSEDRDGHLKELIPACPILGQVHLATDGNSLTESEIGEVYTRSIHQPRYPFALRPAEVGVFLSHRSCWRRLLDEGNDVALILEDDIEFEDVFYKGFELAMNHVQSLEYIQFPVRRVRSRTRPSCNSWNPDGIQIVEPMIVPLGACAQLVFRTAAERLLRATKRFDRPIDCLLQLRNLSGQAVHSVLPSGVNEISRELGGSATHARDRQIGWAEREFKRFAYRMQVRRLSRQYWESAQRMSHLDGV